LAVMDGLPARMAEAGLTQFSARTTAD